MAGQAELWHICVFIVAEGMEMGRRAGGCQREGGRAVGLRWGQCVCVAVGSGLLMLEREREREGETCRSGCIYRSVVRKAI